MTTDVGPLVLAVVSELNERWSARVPVEQGREAALFGEDGLLDSIALVELVLSLEEAVEDRYGAVIMLADEHAISQTVSPFRTIGTLADYIAQRLAQTERQR